MRQVGRVSMIIGNPEAPGMANMQGDQTEVSRGHHPQVGTRSRVDGMKARTEK